VKQTPPIVVSGSIAIDRIMNFSGTYRDHIRPEKLDSLSISIFLDSLKDTYGGVGANIAYTLALLGDQPYLLGSVGHDGLMYMEHLAHRGVNIQYVHESELSTASFNVITDTDQNQVGGFYPGAMFDSESLTLAPWKDQSPIIVVSPHDPIAMARQVAECKEWGLTLLYDVGQQVNNLEGKALKDGVLAADILILNDYEMTVLGEKTGLQVEKIKQTVPIVITTLGKDGSVIEGTAVAEPVQIGSVLPETVVDPTGAGDAYRAGFLYGYARGWPLKESAQLGATCATYVIESMGTQTHHFTVRQVAERYTNTFKQPLPAHGKN
jgi:adenosine kinase